MLAFPLASGFLVAGVTWAGAAFAALAIVGFLAHESAMIVLGARGGRLRGAHGTHARRRLLALGFVALACITVVVATAPPGLWTPALGTVVLASSVGALLVAGRTKSLAGELLVAATFSSVHAVIAAAAGATPAATWLPVAVWVVSFTLATLGVHALKAGFKGKGPGRWTIRAAPTLAVLVLVAGLAAWRAVGLGVGLAPAPKALTVLAVAALHVHPRHLKRVGWSFVATDLLTLVLVTASLSGS
jgi:hypothetical protein